MDRLRAGKRSMVGIAVDFNFNLTFPPFSPFFSFDFIAFNRHFLFLNQRSFEKKELEFSKIKRTPFFFYSSDRITIFKFLSSIPRFSRSFLSVRTILQFRFIFFPFLLYRAVETVLFNAFVQPMQLGFLKNVQTCSAV